MQSSSKYSDLIEYLNEGKICLFETDTVVGIGCKILNEGKTNSNIERIFDIKNRNSSKALPWLISSKGMLDEWAIKIPKYAINYIEEEWPGATTLVFEVNDRLPEGLGVNMKKDQHTVAFRIPACEELINAIDYIGCPIACTSANISNQKPIKTLDKVPKSILEQVDFVYEKKQKPSGKPSKIVSCIEDEAKIIR